MLASDQMRLMTINFTPMVMVLYEEDACMVEALHGRMSLRAIMVVWSYYVDNGKGVKVVRGAV